MTEKSTIQAAMGTCRVCGRPLREDEIEGACARCLWEGIVTGPPSQISGDPASKPHVWFALPGYTVEHEIARGGMGIVYRAQQSNPPRTVAVKMLLPQQAGSAEMRERFRLEIRAIAGLEHEVILPVYEVGEQDGIPFFTMKLATGGTLAERRALYLGRFREIATLLATLAEAVQFAHERGVLHRDLKPGNILFDDLGRPFISDFGLAKFIQAAAGDTEDLTRSLSVLGTPQYLAPELAAQGPKAATTSADIYSLGAVLYELLAGRPPFQAEGLTVLLKKIAEEAPPPLTGGATQFVRRQGESNPETKSSSAKPPRDLEVICLKCLAKEPARRYASARELAEDLRRWLAGQPILARPASTAEQALMWARRNRGLAASVGVALTLLIALVVGLSISSVRIATSRKEALATVEALEAQKASDLLQAGNTAEGIALLARRVRRDPANWRDTARLMWALQRRQWAIPTRQPIPLAGPGTSAPADEPAGVHLVAGHDGRLRALVISTNLVIRDLLANTNRQEWALPFRPTGVRISEAAGLLALQNDQQEVWFFNYGMGKMLEPKVRATKNENGLTVEFNPSGSQAFIVAPDFSAQLVELTSGKTLTLVTPPKDALASPLRFVPIARFFPDGRRLVLQSGERTVRIVDCETGGFTGRTFEARQRPDALLISPDGRILVTFSMDGEQFWEVESGRELRGPPDVALSFKPGAFHPDGLQYYQAGNASGLLLFDTLKGEVSKRVPRGALLNGSCNLDAERHVVLANFERSAVLFSADTGRPLCEPIAHTFARNCTARLGNGGVTTLDKDAIAVAWEVKSNRFQPLALRHAAAVQFATFSPDGGRVVTASHDGTAQVWNAATGERVGAAMVHGDKVWTACFSPDGRRVATASWNGSARLWDSVTGSPLSPPLRASNYVFHVEFSPDGRQLLACGEDGVTRLYDVETGKHVFALAHGQPVYWAHFSPDGRLIVTRPMTEKPKLWDAHNGRMLLELDEPAPRLAASGVVSRGEFSRDGQWLALASANRYATVWHLPDGRLHKVLNHVAPVRTARFSPDLKTILTTADDLAGQLWDFESGRAISPPLNGPRPSNARPNTGNALRAGAIHPDGRRAVTGGSDALARLWDLTSGLPLGDPAEFEGSLMHAEFSPDGARLLLACFNGTAQILPLPPVVERAPDWLAPLAEALVGQRINENGATESVSQDQLWELSEEIRHLNPGDPNTGWVHDVLDF